MIRIRADVDVVDPAETAVLERPSLVVPLRGQPGDRSRGQARVNRGRRRQRQPCAHRAAGPCARADHDRARLWSPTRRPRAARTGGTGGCQVVARDIPAWLNRRSHGMPAAGRATPSGAVDMRVDPNSGTTADTRSGWRLLGLASAVLVVLGAAGCSPAPTAAGPQRAAAGQTAGAAGQTAGAAGQTAGAAPVAGEASSASATTADLARAVYDRMNEAQRIGQLFVVGAPVTGLGTATRTAITTYHVGSVVLTGRTTAGPPAVRALTSVVDALTTSAATSRVPLFVATDQEGGSVQVLQGTVSPGCRRL